MNKLALDSNIETVPGQHSLLMKCRGGLNPVSTLSLIHEINVLLPPTSMEITPKTIISDEIYARRCIGRGKAVR